MMCPKLRWACFVLPVLGSMLTVWWRPSFFLHVSVFFWIRFRVLSRPDFGVVFLPDDSIRPSEVKPA